MGRITEECVRRIKDSADIVELIGKYLPLKRAGSAWKGCCPFHAEKTPSFSVNPSRQTFKCFGCGAGGDAVKFVMMFENLDYPTALRKLADMTGVAVIEEQENAEMQQQRKQRSRIIAANQWAAQYFHKLLRTSPAAGHVRAYLQSRDFDIEVVKNWYLGWAPGDTSELCRRAHEQHLSPEALQEAFLLGSSARGPYAVFRDRLMFPIQNLRGEVVGFSGRVMQNDGKDPRKYVNTSETAAFHKGELLFGLHKATRAISENKYTVMLCEGQIDVISCHEKAGLRFAVAALGTAFTDDHARLLRKYATRAVLCFDGDSAGIKASEKAYRKLASAGMQVLQAELPPGEDPDSLIRTQGADVLRDRVASARPYLECRLEREKAAAANDLNARAALIPRMIDLACEITDPNQRDVSVADMATRLNKGLDEMRQAVAENLRQRKRKIDSHREYAPRMSSEPEDTSLEGEPEAPVIPIVIHRAIMTLCRLATCNRDAQTAIAERIEELQEPIALLSGGIVLQRLLETLPEPGNAAAWAQFLQTLPPEQAAGLAEIEPRLFELDKPDYYVEEACERVARASLLQRQDAIRAQLENPALSGEERLRLMARSMELRKLLLE